MCSFEIYAHMTVPEISLELGQVKVTACHHLSDKSAPSSAASLPVVSGYSRERATGLASNFQLFLKATQRGRVGSGTVRCQDARGCHIEISLPPTFLVFGPRGWLVNARWGAISFAQSMVIEVNYCGVKSAH